MGNLSDSIVRICVDNTLAFMRSHANLQGTGDGFWWMGIQLAWVKPFYLGCGKTPTADQLSESLAEHGVRPESIRKMGKHTLVELNNIAFVFREKQYKHSEPMLKVSPHIRGAKFSACGHAFVNAVCPVDELVAFMLAIDTSVPTVRAACADAFQDGLRERKEREIRQQIADAYLDNLFCGDIPREIRSCTIADSTPGAMDLIRLKVGEPGVKLPARTFDIPFSERDRLPGSDWVRQFISDTSILAAYLELFFDDETGETCPILRISSSLSDDYD